MQLTEVADTVVTTDDGVSFAMQPRLPRPLQFHCTVILNKEAFFIAGGQKGEEKRPVSSDEAFLYDKYSRCVD